MTHQHAMPPRFARWHLVSTVEDVYQIHTSPTHVGIDSSGGSHPVDR